MIAAAHQTMLSPPALPYDAEVEYLESTGTQYVDTGYILATDSKVSVSGVWTYRSTATADAMQMGIIKDTDTANYRTVFCNQQGYMRIYSAGVDIGFSNSGLPRIDYTIDFPNRNASINSTSGTVSSSLTGTFTRPWYLFARCGSGTTPDSWCKFRLESATFHHAGTLVLDFVPVRVGAGSSAVGYLFDRVSGTLFGNAGTGAFVIGPDKT